MQPQEIAILDFGSQYTHLIARLVRELGVVSHIYSSDANPEQLQNAAGIILSGGPISVLSDHRPPHDPRIFDLGKPVLGLCYGHQLIAQHFGGRVVSGSTREYGVAELTTSDEQLSILKDIPKQTKVWMSHGDNVEKLPVNFVSIAQTRSDKNTAVACEEKKIYGFQYHPEVFHTENGRQMVENFLYSICKAEKNWDSDLMLDSIQEQIRTESGDKKVFLLISGGVDSTVCFALLEKTLGKDRVYGFHIDHGLMRLGESNYVKNTLKDIGLDDLDVYNAEAEYLEKLSGIYEPEEKRKIIGNLFLDITERKMQELGFNEDEWLLGQGTIYPDTIESGGTKHSDKIKTHHNRVDRVTDMIEKGLIIEPIKELYKDEVREIGYKLGLPKKLVDRHPFPGPGLGIRCLCSTGKQHLKKSVDQDYPDIRILPIKSVGVQGDERTYAHPAVLLGGQRDWQEIRKVSPQITNTESDVNRILITLLGDEQRLPDSTLREAYLTSERLDLLRKFDNEVNKFVLENKDCKHIWQMPIVLVPFGHTHGESLVIRPAESREVMTIKFGELPEQVISDIKKVVSKIGGIDYLFYDVTNKPPGTMEWE